MINDAAQAALQRHDSIDPIRIGDLGPIEQTARLPIAVRARRGRAKARHRGNRSAARFIICVAARWCRQTRRQTRQLDRDRQSTIESSYGHSRHARDRS